MCFPPGLWLGLRVALFILASCIFVNCFANVFSSFYYCFVGYIWFMAFDHDIVPSDCNLTIEVMLLHALCMSLKIVNLDENVNQGWSTMIRCTHNNTNHSFISLLTTFTQKTSFVMYVILWQVTNELISSMRCMSSKWTQWRVPKSHL